ncbi:glycosyltransferase family protein [Blastococcus sp. SYSU DS0533]
MAKDPWHPAVRREQMIARELVRQGRPVSFLQAPADWRRLRSDPANWWGHLTRARFAPAAPGVRVSERSTVLPGSRGPLAERLDAALLGALLRRSDWEVDVTAFMLPWEWRAAGAVRGRVVFDCTDDWARLLPHARRLPDQLRRIAAEADEVVVVNPLLAELFPGRQPVVVPNGTDADLLAAPRTGERAERHAVYVGSVAERFDVDLVRGLLRALPDWTFSVHGQLVFPDRARAAAERFRALVAGSGGRLTYHGLLPRDRLAAVLDTATVGLLPDVAGRALGQSSMKSYDYAARGLPLVATAGHLEHAAELPPHTAIASGADEMASAVRAAAAEPAAHAVRRREWAAARTWARRTEEWLDAALGRPAPAAGSAPAA